MVSVNVPSRTNRKSPQIFIYVIINPLQTYLHSSGAYFVLMCFAHFISLCAEIHDDATCANDVNNNRN